MSKNFTSEEQNFLEKFKTIKCTHDLKKSLNHDAKKCYYYHDYSDKRRNPFFSDSTNANRFNTDTYRYTVYDCRHRDNCSDSHCRWAHSNNEIKYHPNVTLIFSRTYKLHLKIN